MSHGIDATSRVQTRGGVSLVAVRLVNPTPVDRVAVVENRLDGEVLPPRSGGVVDSGWDADGFRGVVAAEDERALGFACRAPPLDPPVAVRDAGRAGDADGPDPTTPRAVRRRLGSPRPPADAVPVPDPGRDDREEPDGPEPTDPAEDLPGPVADWFAEIEGRVERAERLGGSVPEATTALADAGGLDTATTLPDRTDADAARLRTVARRARRLATRAEAADVPVDALRRLA